MFEPVRHQDGFPVGRFDEVFQRIQLSVVQLEGFVILAIDSSIGHLTELPSKGSCVSGVDLLTAQGNHKVGLHGVVGFTLLFGELDYHFVDHAFGHLQVIRSLHGNGDIRNGIVDCVLCTGQRLI